MIENLKFLLKQLYPSVLERGQRMYNVSGSKIVIKEETDDFVLVSVPSEIKPAPYNVTIHFRAEKATCDCPYFKDNRQPCKHIASAYFKLLEKPKEVEEEIPQKALNDSAVAVQARNLSLDYSYSKNDAINFDQIDLDHAAEKLAKSSFQELSKMLNSISKSMEIVFVSERLLKFQIFSNWSSYHLDLVRHPEGFIATCSCKNYSNFWCPHTWYVLLEIVNNPENRMLDFIQNYNHFFDDDARRFKLDTHKPGYDPNNYFDIVFKGGKLVSIYKDKTVNILDDEMDWQKYTSIMPQLDLDYIPTSKARNKKNAVYHTIYLWTDLRQHPKSSSFRIYPYAVKLNKNGQYSKTLKEFNADFISKYYSNLVDYNFHDEIIQDLKGLSENTHLAAISDREVDFIMKNNVHPHKRDYVSKELKHEYNRKIVMNIFSKLKDKQNYINLHKRDAEDIHSYTPIKLNDVQISLGINIKKENNYILFYPFLYNEEKEFPITSLFTNYFVLDNRVLYPIKAYDSLILYKLFYEVDNLKWLEEDWVKVHENMVKPFQEYLKVNIDPQLPIAPTKTIQCEITTKVYLKEYETGLLLVPAFCYQLDDFYKEVNMDRGLIAHHYYQNETYQIERDAIYESDMEQMLRGLHPSFESQVTEHYFNLTEDKVLENNWLFKVFKIFNENNIEILGQKNLKNYNYNSNNPTIRLKSGSGIDWFDIEVKVSFGNQVLKLTELRNAILNNQQYVRLGDGTIGVLPEEWIAKYSSLFKLGKVNKEKLELNQFQLTAIDEYVGEIDHNEQIIELQEKIARLQNFKEIKQTPLPTNTKAVLRDYQINGYHWLRFLHEYGWGGCLADDMGLGKTVQVLTFLQSLINENKQFKALVVVPTSLIFNWENEILKFTPTIKYLLHSGMERTRTTNDFSQFQLIITSYGLLRRDLEMFKSFEFDYVILDESQAIKNPLSKISRGVRLLKTKNRLVMTGTPVENSTFDLYAQLDFSNPGMLGSLENFKTNFAYKIDKEQDEETAAKLRKIIYPFVLNRKKEVVAKELPEKTEIILFCEMDVIQRKIYETYKIKIKEEIREAIDEQGLNKAGLHILRGLTKLRQLCNHPALLNEEDFSKSSSIKMNLLFEHLEELLENKKKVLVFSFFSSMLDLVEKKMIDKHYQYVKITGETKDRKGKVEEFQNNEDTKVFLISLKAGGTGLNLTAAEYVF
ncbi:MAG: SWIM zinc finger family protein [Bacteroidetes bacterium]|nr:SWIM zinc finger family protein [Bacteroidota bacterium]